MTISHECAACRHQARYIQNKTSTGKIINADTNGSMNIAIRIES